MRGWFPSNRRDRRGKGGPPVDERYLSQNEQSRTSARPLPLEVIENIQEAIWSGISGSVKAVLHRLVDMALADEATDRVGAAWHERTAERRAHRNGTYTRDLQTTMGQIEDLRVPRVRMPDGSSPGGWATFDRYERRTYELDRLIGQLFLAGVSGRNLERAAAVLGDRSGEALLLGDLVGTLLAHAEELGDLDEA